MKEVVSIAAEDTMLDETSSTHIRAKIFEPFFTTKDIGLETGLGLSTTPAIVKSHDGFINLYSKIGEGTTFRVYIPASLSSSWTRKPQSGRSRERLCWPTAAEL
ncbi:MAG TPA: ATP-binding protein [Bacteroidota bacterium]|nr:ATP-binding protein [Bacteroidota bacterium]